MDYETWRIGYQSSEQAARAAFMDAQRLARELHQLQQGLDELLKQSKEAGDERA